jgi:hypothetical protein
MRSPVYRPDVDGLRALAVLAALTAPIDERLRRIAAAAGARVIEPTESLCTPALCPSAGAQVRRVPVERPATLVDGVSTKGPIP